MPDVVIIGGGFAGLSAIRRLARKGGDPSITLIDPREGHHFLPLLPDMIGRDLPGRALLYPFREEQKRGPFTHVKARVLSLDPERRVIATSSGEFPYDVAIIASGAETNFYNHPEFAAKTFAIDGIDDVERLQARLRADDFGHVVIVGGGYAGVEMATVLWRRFRRAGAGKSISIVQSRERILHQLPEKFTAYAEANLRGLGLEIIPNRTVADIDGTRVTLDQGETFDSALVVWTAGSRTADFVRALPFEKNGQGRLAVGRDLLVGDHLYAAGNAAGFVHEGELLRMGVQFSLMEGACAADNAVRSLRGEEPKPLRPVDLGHVIPMANGRSCGEVMGVPVFGRLPTLLHYFMSVFRSYGRNRLTVLRALAADR